MRLLIIDDHPLTCAGLKSLLQTCYPSVVIDTRHTAHGLNELAALADYIFLDMHLPDSSFLHLLDNLHPYMPRVILISANPEPSAVAEARQRGARGLLLKNADIDHVLAGFKRIQAGELVFDGTDPPITSTIQGLTERQREVFDAVLVGLSNKQIARLLGISEYTVKEHVAAILPLFGVRNRLELVLKAKPQ